MNGVIDGGNVPDPPSVRHGLFKSTETPGCPAVNQALTRATRSHDTQDLIQSVRDRISFTHSGGLRVLSVAVVDDEQVAIDLVAEALRGTGAAITATYFDARSAVQGIAVGERPDLVIMDIGLPDLSGIEATRMLKAARPELEVIVQTMFEDPATIVAAIKAGASGYLLKGGAREELQLAVREVTRGGSFLSGRVARQVLQEFRQPAASSDFGLTEREESILALLVKGQSDKEIAVGLGISPHTVNNHLRRIYEKLQVRSRAEAVAKALKLA